MAHDANKKKKAPNLACHRACVAQVRAFVCGDASGTACKLIVIPALTIRALETNDAQILWCSA